MTKLLAVGLLLVAGVAPLPAQAFLQISSVKARPEVLSCTGPGAVSVVRVQVYLAGIPEAAKSATATAQLAIYAARPSISRIAIREASKEFTLSDSPALVDFEVVCTSETLPGEITLAATISAASDGLPVKEPMAEPSVHLKIVPPR